MTCADFGIALRCHGVAVPAYQAVAPYDPSRGRPVHPSVAGSAVVSVDELERKLGHTAFAVWKAMLQCRSEDGGVCHATLNGLAKRCDRKPEAVRYGLRKLRDAGLVEDVGWRMLTVFADGLIADRRVYVRTVRGALVGSPVSSANVPEATSVWVAAANTHGGWRHDGSAPHLHHRVLETRTRQDNEPASCPSSLPVDLGQDYRKCKSQNSGSSLPVDRVEGGSSLPPDIYMEEKTLRTEPFPSGKTAAGVGRAPLAIFEVGQQPTGETQRERMTRFVDAALGTARPNVAAPILVGGPLPPYPNTALVKPATIPMPPMVDANADDYTKARMIVNAYCGACETRLGKPCRVLRGEKSLRGSKLFTMLVKAADLLAEKKISPFAWAAWWLDNHIARGREDRPPIQVMFGNASVGDHIKRNIFRKSGKIYGGRVVFGATHLELIRRYEAMRQHLRTIAFTTEADVAAIVNEHFPPGQWGLLVDTAQKEAAALKAQHEAAIHRGEFLW